MESWYPAPSLPHWPGQLLKQGGGKVLDPHKLEKEDEVVHIPNGHVWTFMLHDCPAVLDGFEVGDIARLVNQVYVFLCQPLHGRFGCVAGSRQPHPGGSCGTQAYLRSRISGPGDTQCNHWSSWWCFLELQKAAPDHLRPSIVDSGQGEESLCKSWPQSRLSLKIQSELNKNLKIFTSWYISH